MHDHFLKLICDQPADIGPRLVYADWLEEHGDPRGEFIRVQCALSGLANDDPQQTSLKRREHELLRLHQQEWLRPLEQLLGPNEPRQPVAAVAGWLASILPREIARVVRGVATNTFPAWQARFKNGFVERLEIDHDRLSTVKDIPVHIPLRQLHVSRGATTVGNPMSWMTNGLMKHIWELHVSTYTIDESQWVRCWETVRCPCLDSLMFTTQPFHGLVAIANAEVASRLKSISIVGNPFDSSDVSLLSRFSALNGLTLCGLGIDADLIGELSRQAICARLVELAFTNCALGNVAVLHLDAARYPNLRQLFLETCELGDAAAEHVAVNPLLRQLSHLSLCDNQVTDRGALTLADSPNWRGMTTIDLTYNPISPDVHRALKIRFGDRILVDSP